MDPAYKYIAMFRGGVQWYVLETKEFISNINFRLKSGNASLVSFNGQTINFIYAIKKISPFKCQEHYHKSRLFSNRNKNKTEYEVNNIKTSLPETYKYSETKYYHEMVF